MLQKYVCNNIPEEPGRGEEGGVTDPALEAVLTKPSLLKQLGPGAQSIGAQ